MLVYADLYKWLHYSTQLNSIQAQQQQNMANINKNAYGKDLTLQRAKILICRSGLEYWRLKHELISKLSFRASICYQIEIFPKKA